MLTEPERKPLSGARNPLLYTSLLVLLSMLYAGWVLFSRRQEVREMEEKAKAEKLAEDQKIVESLGGNRFEILNFYASPPVIHRGETAQLCYGVSNAKAVHLEPADEFRVALVHALRGRRAQERHHVHADRRGWPGKLEDSRRGSESALEFAASCAMRDTPEHREQSDCCRSVPRHHVV